jgi:hypothetical protein
MLNMFRIKLVSDVYGIDDHSPIYQSLEQARKVAIRMLHIYHGQVRVEIYQMLDARSRNRRLVESMGSAEGGREKKLNQ